MAHLNECQPQNKHISFPGGMYKAISPYNICMSYGLTLAAHFLFIYLFWTGIPARGVNM